MTRLTIGIDGFNLAMPRGTGVATYGSALTRVLTDLGHRTTGIFGIGVGRDPALKEILFFDQIGREAKPYPRRYHWRRALRHLIIPALATEVSQTSRVERRAFAERLPTFDRLLSSPWLFERAHQHYQLTRRFLELRISNPPDIMHWTYPLPIRLSGARNIYTLHDLVPLRLPYTTLDNKRFYYRLVRDCVVRGDHVVTVSESSRTDILAQFDVAPGKITNTYQTAPLPAALLTDDRTAHEERIRGMFGLEPRGYFLFYGALDPKKNLGRIVEAYLISGSRTPLVIVGGRHWGTDAESRMFANGKVSLYGSDAERSIRLLDYLPRDILMQMVSCAKAVVFPSLYEGFGLPVLEAIRLGTPVITSNVSSLPEVTGAAGLMVDPYDVAAIAGAIRDLDGDPALAERLVAAAPAQAAKFSDEAYRTRLSAMYEQILATRQA